MLRDERIRAVLCAPVRFMNVNQMEMGIRRTAFFLRKWLLRIAISFMLGFSNAINQDSKSIDDTTFKIEETTKK